MAIDFHSHVLPGIDDGSASVEESLQMLAMQASQGITHTVATPHFYPSHQRFEEFLERRAQALETLQQAMAGKNGLPEVIAGAEVHYFPGIGSCEALKQLTIGGGRYILIEMPAAQWTQRMYQELADISANQGLVPVAAHVDRYLGTFSTRGIPEKLMEFGCLIQANASAFLTPLAARQSLALLRREQIHLLGSDCHNVSSRPPQLGKALDKIRSALGEEAIARLDGLGQQVLFSKQ
ncbi:MAG: hypothetical protein IJN53_05835 [Oscillospiraceae bacterium]|nr:hypothetical protein [Oscillospiraceae bacterium]